MTVIVTILFCITVFNFALSISAASLAVKLQKQLTSWESAVAAWGVGVEKLTVNTAEMLKRVGDIVNMRMQ